MYKLCFTEYSLMAAGIIGGRHLPLEVLSPFRSPSGGTTFSRTALQRSEARAAGSRAGSK